MYPNELPAIYDDLDMMDIMNLPRNSNFPYGLKPPKVFARRDFPEGCNALAFRIKGKENAVNCADVLTKTKSVKGKHVNSFASCSRNYVRGVNDNEVANLSVVPHDVMDENNVKETLKLFRELFKELSDEHKRERKQKGLGVPRFDMEAANRIKESGNWVCPEKCFGHIPGIEIGDKFHYRTELVLVGLHSQNIAGIDYLVLNGEKFATSVVDSGRYENEAKTDDVLVYSGQGNKSDQEMKLGNLALVNSMKAKYPVRVIQKTKSANGCSSFTYDGLYVVNRFWQERDRDVKFVFKFELHRMSGQEKVLRRQNSGESRKSGVKECCVVYDVSQGKEKMAIRAMNGEDGEKPRKFGYITKTIYLEWCKGIRHGGCDCTDGCLNSGQCVCVLKNGGEIPYSEKGVLMRRKGVVYECGPFCKCPPSCLNRVSQSGPRYQLELYKTESRGWGVRSRSYISSGSFVCEFVGKLQQIKEANQETDHDPHGFYGFVISKPKNHNVSSATSSSGSQSDNENENETGFIIDASKAGNVGRFIRYSISPSLVVQRVLYDHEDKRMPHIMFFAAKNIPPLQELTCDYNGFRKSCN